MVPTVRVTAFETGMRQDRGTGGHVERRELGATGLRVSELGFGCGMVGGLMTYGEYPVMRRTVARAVELGVTYFDTAPMYADGQSEVNLGAVLRELRLPVIVGTKVFLQPADMVRVGPAIRASLEASLRRLGAERVDLLQLHNPIAARRRTEAGWVGVEDVAEACRAFETLAQQGKVRCWGVTALGETDALQRAIEAGGFHSVQTVYNLLNPSAGQSVPPGFPYQDYGRLIDRAATRGMGSIAIRTLAAGALSGSIGRHPVAAASVAPLATGRDYGADVAAARRFDFLVQEGVVGSLPEAALRFAISKPELSVAMVGLSSPEQLEAAVAAVQRGPLPPEVLARLQP
jgi:L-galactose dehydrogenase/L-glyceraldehyde 3-phosphate reductase